MEIIIIILLIVLLGEASILVYLALTQSRPRNSQHPVFIDTSALMDGRIVTAAQTGFIPRGLTVPKSVIAELHLLADQADSDKRMRARRGLDAIAELQQLPNVSVTILEDGSTGTDGVDGRLVELAKKYDGAICTIDFNLNKVASVQGVQVLNVNELAGNIRMAFLPGESFELRLTQKGQESGQAVGYLGDGTMVVVDKAAQSVGDVAQVEVIRSLQTAAGRMVFGKLLTKPTSPSPHHGNSKSAPSHNAKSSGTQSVRRSKKATSPNAHRKPRNNEASMIELANSQSGK